MQTNSANVTGIAFKCDIATINRLCVYVAVGIHILLILALLHPSSQLDVQLTHHTQWGCSISRSLLSTVEDTFLCCTISSNCIQTCTQAICMLVCRLWLRTYALCWLACTPSHAIQLPRYAWWGQTTAACPAASPALLPSSAQRCWSGRAPKVLHSPTSSLLPLVHADWNATFADWVQIRVEQILRIEMCTCNELQEITPFVLTMLRAFSPLLLIASICSMVIAQLS